MPTSLIVAFFLLVLIYVFALVYAVLVDPRFGVVTALAGLVVFAFVIISQACLTRGGCHFLAWIYVLLYLAALLTLLFLTAIVTVARYKDHPSVAWVREWANVWMARKGRGGDAGGGAGEGGGPAGPLWHDPLGPPMTNDARRTGDSDDDHDYARYDAEEKEEDRKREREREDEEDEAPQAVQNHAFTRRRQERVRRMLEERRARDRRQRRTLQDETEGGDDN